jgi:hypothetical protein
MRILEAKDLAQENRETQPIEVPHMLSADCLQLCFDGLACRHDIPTGALQY